MLSLGPRQDAISEHDPALWQCRNTRRTCGKSARRAAALLELLQCNYEPTKEEKQERRRENEADAFLGWHRRHVLVLQWPFFHGCPSVVTDVPRLVVFTGPSSSGRPSPQLTSFFFLTGHWAGPRGAKRQLMHCFCVNTHTHTHMYISTHTRPSDLVPKRRNAMAPSASRHNPTARLQLLQQKLATCVSNRGLGLLFALAPALLCLLVLLGLLGRLLLWRHFGSRLVQ